MIDNSYQSCSTIVWELLKEEGYDVKANRGLSIAFLYGLYTDTSSYVDLYKKNDIAMRDELRDDYPELERLKKILYESGRSYDCRRSSTSCLFRPG